MPFILLKVIHILAAITAVGANVTYASWLRRAGKDPVHLRFAIEGVRRLDALVANPAYILVVITGVLMVLTGAYSFDTGWIAAAIVLYIILALFGIFAFTPAIRHQGGGS